MLARRVMMGKRRVAGIYLAKDSDFSGTSNTKFIYIGTKESLIIPTVIKGVTVTSYQYLFRDSIPISEVYIQSPSVTAITRMFQYNNSYNVVLHSPENNITRMDYMFVSQSSLETVDMSNFDASKMTRIDWAFSGCSSLVSLNLPSLEGSKITSTDRVFYGCSSLEEIDVSNLVSSSTTSVILIFFNNSSLKNIYGLETWNTSNVRDIQGMFNGCSLLTELDLSNWDTSKITAFTGVYRVFNGCTNLVTLDLSSWTLSQLSYNVQDMFAGCESLQTVYVKDATEKTWFETFPTNTPAQVQFIIK